MASLDFLLILLLRGFWETMKHAIEDTRYSVISLPHKLRLYVLVHMLTTLA